MFVVLTVMNEFDVKIYCSGAIWYMYTYMYIVHCANVHVRFRARGGHCEVCMLFSQVFSLCGGRARGG